MALNSSLLFLTFFLFSFLAIQTAHSRTSSETTVLDVSASLQKTLDILSFQPQTSKPLNQQDFPTTTTTTTTIITPISSPFSLPLHTRDSLYPTQHKDYKSLLLSRLARDATRVNSLNTKLSLSLHNIHASDLEPLSSEVRPEDISTPVVSGVDQGSGEYFSRIGVGTPSKPFYLVVDTGSDVNWLQCKPCSDCYQQTDPIFDPTTSTSYSLIPCGSPTCGALDMEQCRNGTCQYQVSYGDGSFTIGDFATEALSFGSSGSVSNIAIGCGHDNEGLFVGAAGLIGLGGGSLSIINQLKASSFSYCFVDRDSTKSSTLEFNSVRPSDSVTTALSRSKKLSTFYYVGLTGISVGGQVLPIPQSLFQMDESGNGGIIVDSGTAITRLQTQAYNTVRDAFVRFTRDLPSANKVALFDTCYDLSSKTRVTVPTVSFHFGYGKTLSLPAKNYLIPVDSAGTFCFAFAPTTSSLSIIGNVQQMGTRVSFDLANSVVGFSSSKC